MDWLKELLGEELFAQVSEKLGETKIVKDDGNFIPKSRFDEINTQKNEYKKQLQDRDTQLEDLKKKATGNEDLLKQLEELKATNQKTTEDFEAKLKQQAFDFALEKGITGAKAKNAKAIKALLNLEGLELEGDGIKGLEDQLKTLRESDAYLFGEDTPAGMGGSAGNQQRQQQTSVDETKMTDAEWFAYKNEQK